MRCTKNAKLGTFLDVSSFETPFSYYGRMSDTKERILFGISKTIVLSSIVPMSPLNAKIEQKVCNYGSTII